MLLALIGTYSSYLVTIGILSNLSESSLFLTWLISGIALVLILFGLNKWRFLDKKMVLRKIVLKYLPISGMVTGVFVLVGGFI